MLEDINWDEFYAKLSTPDREMYDRLARIGAMYIVSTFAPPHAYEYNPEMLPEVAEAMFIVDYGIAKNPEALLDLMGRFSDAKEQARL